MSYITFGSLHVFFISLQLVIQNIWNTVYISCMSFSLNVENVCFKIEMFYWNNKKEWFMTFYSYFCEEKLLKNPDCRNIYIIVALFITGSHTFLYILLIKFTERPNKIITTTFVRFVFHIKYLNLFNNGILSVTLFLSYINDCSKRALYTLTIVNCREQVVKRLVWMNQYS